MRTVVFTPQGRLSQFADWLMKPLMYLVQGQTNELPQQTHVWNNKKFQPGELDWLDSSMIVIATGDKEAARRTRIPIFHMPRFGGWKKFLVLTPSQSMPVWFIGWKTDDVCGVSLIRIYGSVRVLRGPGVTSLFAVDCVGNQISLTSVGAGELGQKHPFTSVPLL